MYLPTFNYLYLFFLYNSRFFEDAVGAALSNSLPGAGGEGEGEGFL